MDFGLTYEGPLPTKKLAGAPAKHAIRMELHQQVKALSESGTLAQSTKERLANPDSPKADVEVRKGHMFLPLVRKGMTASLDIVMLRGDDTTSLVIEGDIDNRLKTLFDALSVPRPEQVPAGWSPGPTEKPVFCLLADDQLINGVSVQAHRWWSAPSPDHVRLFIKVSASSGAVMMFNMRVLM
jgi:hypothetical protein